MHHSTPISPLRARLAVCFGAAVAFCSACDGGGSVPPADPSCGRDAIIEDAENGDDQIIVVEGRSGYVYTYVDELGSSIEPGGDAYQPGWPGAHKSRSAIHIKGKLAAGEAYAGVGFAMVDGDKPYDVSKYKGVSFLAKAGEGSTTSMRFKMPDVNTDPKGGKCSECYNDFGIDFAVTNEWTRYTVMFSDLKQGEGWGNPNPLALEVSSVLGMQWQTAASGKDYDLWIDDVSFVGCE